MLTTCSMIVSVVGFAANGLRARKCAPTNVIAAFATNVTSKRKPTTTIMANDATRSRTICLHPPRAASTCHTALSASCNDAKRLLAVNANATQPIVCASAPWRGLSKLASISFLTVSAAAGPAFFAISEIRLFSASVWPPLPSRLSTPPTTAIRITKSGATAKIVENASAAARRCALSSLNATNVSRVSWTRFIDRAKRPPARHRRRL